MIVHARPGTSKATPRAAPAGQILNHPRTQQAEHSGCGTDTLHGPREVLEASPGPDWGEHLLERFLLW